MTGRLSLGSVQSTRNPSLFQLYNQGLRSKMIADAEGDVNHVVCGVEAEQIETAAWRSFREIEPHVVEFSFGEHRDMSGEVITESELRVESKFRAGLRIIRTEGGIFDLRDENSGTDCEVRLESGLVITEAEIQRCKCENAHMDAGKLGGPDRTIRTAELDGLLFDVGSRAIDFCFKAEPGGGSEIMSDLSSIHNG